MSEFAKFSTKIDGRAGSCPEPCVIRVATEVDLREVAEIAAVRESEPVEKWRRSIERTYAAASEGRAQLLVAACQGRIVGYRKTSHFSLPDDSAANVAPPGWYLSGVVVRSAYRRLGIGSRLTIARLSWIAGRTDRAFYFANARNTVSIEMHRAVGFVEVTRDFYHPDALFEGGVGILFTRELGDLASLESEVGS